MLGVDSTDAGGAGRGSVQYVLKRNCKHISTLSNTTISDVYVTARIRKDSRRHKHICKRGNERRVGASESKDWGREGERTRMLQTLIVIRQPDPPSMTKRVALNPRSLHRFIGVLLSLCTHNI